MKPHITKLGTLDLDMVETTPVVFRGTLYRFEYVRQQYWANATGASFFRFIEHETGRAGTPFAHGCHLGNVLADDDRVIVTGTNAWNGERVDPTGPRRHSSRAGSPLTDREQPKLEGLHR